VGSKEDLVSKFVAHITARFPVPPYDGGGWLKWAPQFAYALLHMYEAVPGLADYTIRQTHTSDTVLLRHEISMVAACSSGFDDVGALYATRAVVEFVAGWVAREQRRGSLERELGAHPDVVFRRYVFKKVPDRYPQLCASLRAAADLDSHHRFSFTLNALIAGLNSTMSKGSSASRSAQRLRTKRQGHPRSLPAGRDPK
jgi:hypothetical protein